MPHCARGFRRCLTPNTFTPRKYAMMLQELFDRWNEIQKLRSGNEGREQDWLSEELNLLEAMRLLDCRAIPDEPSNIQALISDRHRRLEAILRKRKD